MVANGSLVARPIGGRLLRAVSAWLLAVLLALGTLAATTGGVAGHAILLRTDPPDGVVLVEPPHEVHLWFTEPVLLPYSSFDLVDGDGKPLEVGGVRAADGKGSEIAVVLPALGTDTFRLNWSTVSADDLHAASGSLVFGVSAGPTSRATQPASAIAWSEIALGWASFAAFAGFVGSLVVAFLVLPAAPTDIPGGRLPGNATWLLATRLRKRLVRTAIAAAAAGLLVTVLTIAAKSSDLASVALTGGAASGLLATDHGVRTLGIAILMSLAVILLAPLVRRGDPPAERLDRRDRAALLALAGIAIVVAALRAENSHAASGGELGALSILAAALHSLSVALWMGGVAALALTTVPLLAGGPAAVGLAVRVLRRFGIFAASGLAIVMVTGLVVASGLVASIDSLVFSVYGQLLMAKVGLASLVALVALANAATLHPRVTMAIVAVPRLARQVLRTRGRGATPGATARPSPPRPDVGRRRLRLLVPIEAAGALAIVALASTLAATPPAQGPEWAPAVVDPVATETVTGQADDLLVTLQIRPNRPGRNFVTVAVYDTRRPAPAPIDQVRVHLRGPASTGGQAQDVSAFLDARGANTYDAALELPSSGADWQVSVTAVRADLPDAVVVGSWSVLPNLPPVRAHPLVISNQSLRPLLFGLAAVLALLFLVVLALVQAPRRRPPGLRGLERSSIPGAQRRGVFMRALGRGGQDPP